MHTFTVFFILYFHIGQYESPPSNYKHWYFNATRNAFKMWCLIVLGVVTAYECTKHLATLIMDRDVR